MSIFIPHWVVIVWIIGSITCVIVSSILLLLYCICAVAEQALRQAKILKYLWIFIMYREYLMKQIEEQYAVTLSKGPTF